jgi:hypothetical protein
MISGVFTTPKEAKGREWCFVLLFHESSTLQWTFVFGQVQYYSRLWERIWSLRLTYAFLLYPPPQIFFVSCFCRSRLNDVNNGFFLASNPSPPGSWPVSSNLSDPVNIFVLVTPILKCRSIVWPVRDGKKNSVALARERTIPTERPPPVGEVSTMMERER